MVSRVYRLSMLIAANQHEKAANVFDGFMDDLALLVGNSNVESEIKMLDEFLQRDRSDPPTPTGTEKGIRLVIHEDASPVVQVVRCMNESTVEEATEETTEEAAEETEETEETEAAEVVEETEETEAAEETEETEAAEETEETEETEEAEQTEETEEAEETEAIEETEETEEAEETEAVEETEETEETEEAEESSYEPIKIGKNMYFLDTATNFVFEYVSEEEAGEYVGKLVAGKLVRG